jgi:hypothetical protein
MDILRQRNLKLNDEMPAPELIWSIVAGMHGKLLGGPRFSPQNTSHVAKPCLVDWWYVVRPQVPINQIFF